MLVGYRDRPSTDLPRRWQAVRAPTTRKRQVRVQITYIFVEMYVTTHHSNEMASVYISRKKLSCLEDIINEKTNGDPDGIMQDIKHMLDLTADRFEKDTEKRIRAMSKFHNKVKEQLGTTYTPQSKQYYENNKSNWNKHRRKNNDHASNSG